MPSSLQPVLGKTPTGEEYVERKAETNESGVVTEHFVLADGRRKDVVTLQSRDTLIFDSDFDMMLAEIGTRPLDQSLPPQPAMGDLDEAFKKAIKVPIIIKETDSVEVKKMKQAAIDVRQAIADLVAEGYTVAQALGEDRSLREKNIEFRRTFQAELNEIYRSGDKAGAEAYMKKANEELEKAGVIPLTMPGTGKSKRRKGK